jgi:hypothetical protein
MPLYYSQVELHRKNVRRHILSTFFVVGDNVVMPTGAQATVVNPSFTDGTVTLQWASSGQTVQIILTGLTNAQDAAAAFAAGSNTFHV